MCQIKGYYRIPDEYFAALRGKPAQSRDPNIGMLIGDFLVSSRLGEGGFGRVYLALQLPLFMKAALKIMLRGVGDDRMSRGLMRKFESEAMSLARLTHPNIVRLLKYGSFGETPYLVMEFVEGARTLKDEVAERVVQGSIFETGTTRHIINQVLNALQCAHDQMIVHRDIKPENVMLQSVAGDPYFVRVLDFGLAKFLEDGTETSMLFGTPFYMAPEQVMRSNIGPWTDNYAVGVMLYEMMTGRRPFPGKTTEEIVAQKLNQEFDPTERIRDLDVPEFVFTFFRRALAWSPEDRFQHVGELRDAMNVVFDGLAKTHSVSIMAGDLSDLMDSTEISALRQEREEIQQAKKAIEEERKQLEAERRSVEMMKQQIRQSGDVAANMPPGYSQPGAPGAYPPGTSYPGYAPGGPGYSGAAGYPPGMSQPQPWQSGPMPAPKGNIFKLLIPVAVVLLLVAAGFVIYALRNKRQGNGRTTEKPTLASREKRSKNERPDNDQPKPTSPKPGPTLTDRGKPPLAPRPTKTPDPKPILTASNKLGPTPSPTPSPTLNPTPTPKPTPSPTPVPKPKPVVVVPPVMVKSIPSGAEVWSGDQLRGSTPWTWHPTSPSDAVKIELKRRGYQKKALTVTPALGSEVTLKLQRAPRKIAKKKKKKGKTKTGEEKQPIFIK
ncbi:MAG: protein kinase [Myxococcales bacterium]|nr:protein kinase [Myxococcales bacterium]